MVAPDIYKKMGGDVDIAPPVEENMPTINLPEITVEADPTVGTYRSRMLREARKMVENKEDMSRPPMGVRENFFSYLPDAMGFELYDKNIGRHVGDEIYNTTCVDCVQTVEERAGIEGIPKGVYDNRTFWQNAKEYGYELTDNPGPGSVLQFTREPSEYDLHRLKRDMGRKWARKAKKYGYPYHIGIMEDDTTYINDGNAELPVYRQTLIDPTTGKRKRYHAYDRIVPKKEMGAEVTATEKETIKEKITPQGITESVQETENITERIKPKKPLTLLTDVESKKFNLWRQAWGINNEDLFIDLQDYNLPGFFKSNAWKQPGADYRSDVWKR